MGRTRVASDDQRGRGACCSCVIDRLERSVRRRALQQTAHHGCVSDYDRSVAVTSMRSFTHPVVAIVFGAFIVCAETCLHFGDIVSQASWIDLPIHDWLAGIGLIWAGIVGRRDRNRGRLYLGTAWGFMTNLRTHRHAQGSPLIASSSDTQTAFERKRGHECGMAGAHWPSTTLSFTWMTSEGGTPP